MRKIIIDTSPLIIHMVGVFNKNLVNKVSRYNSPDDEWTCVEKLLSQADDVFHRHGRCKIKKICPGKSNQRPDQVTQEQEEGA